MKPDRNFRKDLGRCAFWYPFRWMVRLVPQRLLPLVAFAVGGLDQWGSGRDRRSRMQTNIKAGLGCDDAAARHILADNLRCHAFNMLEFLRYPRLSRERCRRLTVWEGREHLDQALSRHGVILCTAHFGAKQMLQMALGHAGYRVNQINHHLEADALSWVQKNVAQRQRLRVEQRIPCRFFPAKGFLRNAFRCLQAKEILIVAADGGGRKEDMDASFMPVPFLGKRMRVPTNYVSLAQRTGATLLPCFTVREGIRHRIIVHAPLATTVPDAVVQYAAVLESYVRRYPYLWEFWEEFTEGELLAPVQEGEM